MKQKNRIGKWNHALRFLVYIMEEVDYVFSDSISIIAFWNYHFAKFS